jgi:hypothetical protein
MTITILHGLYSSTTTKQTQKPWSTPCCCYLTGSFISWLRWRIWIGGFVRVKQKRKDSNFEHFCGQLIIARSKATIIGDILATGGLELVSIKKLCNSKQDIYSEVGSQAWWQVQNKVNYWKKLAPVEFHKMVSEINPNALYPLQSPIPPALLPSPSPNQHQSPSSPKQSPFLSQKKVATPARLFTHSSSMEWSNNVLITMMEMITVRLRVGSPG